MRKSVFITVLFAFCAMFASADTTNDQESYNYLRGLEAYNNGNIDEALDFFNKEVSENPMNGYAFFAIGIIRTGKDEYGQALTALNMAIKNLPKKDKESRAKAYITRAMVNKDLGNSEATLDDYNAAVKTDPDFEDVYRYRAEYYYDNKNYDLADADYKKMLTLDKGRGMGYLGLGRSSIARGKYDDAIQQTSSAIQLYPDYAQAYAFRSESYFKKGDYDRAAEDALTSYEKDHNDMAFDLMQSIADSSLMPVVTRLKIKAAKEQNRAIWPYLLGIVYDHTKNYSKAVTEFKKSYEMDASDVTASMLSSTYESMGNYDKAIEYIDQAIRLDSTDSRYLALKAELLYDNGKSKEAIDVYTQFIQKNPEFDGGYYRRGFMKDNTMDVDGAIEDYSVSITLDPTYAYAYLGRGDMYLLKGMKDEAMKNYRKVIELDTVPSTSSCAFYAYHQLGEDAKAIAFLDSVLQKYPDDAGSYYDAACLYSRMG